MDKPGKNPTIRDVAKEAGVSIAQVSRVLNNNKAVKPETYLKVRQVIDKIGYVPDTRGGGRAKASTKGRSVLVMRATSDSHKPSPVYLRLISGIENELARHQLKLNISCMENYESQINDNMIDDVLGIILLGSNNQLQMHQSFYQKPCVWAMGSGWGDNSFDRVTYDNSEIGILAANYLLNEGCSKFGVMGYDYDSEIFDSRSHSFAWRLKQEGHECHFFNKTDVGSGWEFPTKDVLAAGIDGLFCVADIITLSFYPHLIAAGRNPGSQIKVVSCNMDESYLASLNPLPAVIDIHPERVGQCAVKQLLRRIENHYEQRSKILTPVEFIPPQDVRERINMI